MRAFLMACVAILAGAGSARAAIISATYVVTGRDFAATGTPPYAAVTESISITFDDARFVSGETAGIVLGASTVTPASPLAFTYVPGADTLFVGGTAAGVAAADPTSSDFALVIDKASSAGAYAPTSLSYSVGRNTIYAATTVGRAAPPTVPEPGSLALLAVPMGATGLVAARRRKPG